MTLPSPTSRTHNAIAFAAFLAVTLIAVHIRAPRILILATGCIALSHFAVLTTMIIDTSLHSNASQ